VRCCFCRSNAGACARAHAVVLTCDVRVPALPRSPGSIYFLTTWLPDEVLGTASMLFTGAGAPLSAVGAVSGGAIMSSPSFDGLLGLHQWRWLFLLQVPNYRRASPPPLDPPLLSSLTSL
jgi:hypothetical protein